MIQLNMPYRDPQDPRARAARRKHYHANKQPYRERTQASKAELTKYVNELKTSTPCMDCGIKYPPFVMEFDHRGGEVKLNNVSELTRYGSRKRIDAEIAKCDLVCANCHRVRTYKRHLVEILKVLIADTCG